MCNETTPQVSVETKKPYGFPPIKGFKTLYIDSFKELKSPYSMVLCAMMAALSIVLATTTSFYITPTIKIGFSGLPNRLVDFLFGPSIGCIFGGMMDVIKFLIKPDGAFFFGYTLTAMLGGLIYGTFFYNLPIKQIPNGTVRSIIKANLKSLLLIFLAEALVKIFLNIGLNTLWSSMMSGKAFLAILPGRLLKNLIQIPVDTVFHFALLLIFTRLRHILIPDNHRF